jgi:hypothetical protein
MPYPYRQQLTTGTASPRSLRCQIDGSPMPSPNWRLQFYADRPVAVAASAAYSAAWSWGHYGKYDDPDDPYFYERQQKYDDAELEMLALMRQSLSIPDVDLTLPSQVTPK